jgi:hypothetical protein
MGPFWAAGLTGAIRRVFRREAAQEARLGVNAGLEQLAQQDGRAESHSVQCDWKRRFLRR